MVQHDLRSAAVVGCRRMNSTPGKVFVEQGDMITADLSVQAEIGVVDGNPERRGFQKDGMRLHPFRGITELSVRIDEHAGFNRSIRGRHGDRKWGECSRSESISHPTGWGIRIGVGFRILRGVDSDVCEGQDGQGKPDQVNQARQWFQGGAI